MASLNLDIRRPCYYGKQKAMFHCLSHVSQVLEPSVLLGGHSGGIVSDTFAIIEFEDGHLLRVKPEDIVFADGGDFNQTYFRPIS